MTQTVQEGFSSKKNPRSSGEKPSSKNSKSYPIERHLLLDEQFIERIKKNQLPSSSSRMDLAASGLTREQLLDLFDSQMMSRLLDIFAREFKRKNAVYYTIGSSGHEANAVVALAFKKNDMAFLHYRSGAFYIQRAKFFRDQNFMDHLILSLMARKADPIAGGRHKVYGSLPLLIPPQTSTIASHLPKALGTAVSIKRAQTLQIKHPLDDDSVVLCSFGDASANHASALCAFNTAEWIAKKRYPLPIVFICEDNGWGISVPTPSDWIESMYARHPHLHYIQANALHLTNTFAAAKEAEHMARVEKKPVFLHLKMVRLLGHAGSDYELHYRQLPEIENDEGNDPLLHTAKLLLDEKHLTNDEIIDRYESLKNKIFKRAEALIHQPQLNSAKAIMASIIPPKDTSIGPSLPTNQARKKIFGLSYEKLNGEFNLSQQINLALTDLMLQYQNIIVFGEDVAKKGGVYRVTADLLQRFGSARVFDTLLDEQTILGQALGHAHNGFLPIPEIQFLAYFHNAEDQLRGEAATLSFFSNGQFSNPMVIRVASFGYQKGFGGHFHNDNSIAIFRDIPGLIVACPSTPADAALMLRRSVALAHQEKRIVLFLEPIALYMEKTLREAYPSPEKIMDFGELGIDGESDELCIITYGNGRFLSKNAAKTLKEKHGITIKIIDLRWLAPLNEKAIIAAVKNCKRILIVDEGRKSGSLSEQIVTLLVEGLASLPHIKRITGEDCFISLGDSWQYLLPSESQIVDTVLDMLKRG